MAVYFHFPVIYLYVYVLLFRKRIMRVKEIILVL